MLKVINRAVNNGKTVEVMESDIDSERWVHINDTTTNKNSVLIRESDLRIALSVPNQQMQGRN